MVKAKLLCAVVLACVAVSVQAEDTIKLGWLGALTGPLSAPVVMMNKAIEAEVDLINKTGGINGTKVELVTRDTVGDPTKAVGLGMQMATRENIAALLGPTGSGEALASVPAMARYNKLQLLPTSVDGITSVEKSPMAFRLLPTNTQFLVAATKYVVQVIKAKKVAIIVDNTGYGTSTLPDAEKVLLGMGLKPVYTALIDPNKTDLSDELGKARTAGADVIMPWTGANGLLARIINGTRDSGWNVPIVGHPALCGSTLKPLLHKPEYWNNVEAVSFLSSTRDAKGNAQPSTRALMNAVRAQFGGKKFDFTFWWYALGYDLAKVSTEAIRIAHSTDPAALRKAMESFHKFAGAFATYTWGASSRDGFPQDELVIVQASTFDDGLFLRAAQ